MWNRTNEIKSRKKSTDIDLTSAHNWDTTSLAFESEMGKCSRRLKARAMDAGVGSFISMTVT